MRLAKYFAAAVAILLALWIVIGEQITGASSNAIVNGRISSIYAPMSGNVSQMMPEIGRTYEIGETIVTIENVTQDNSDLYDLQREQDDLLSEIISLNKNLKITNTEIDDIQTLFDKNMDTAIIKNEGHIARLEERIRLFDEIESARVKTKGAKLSDRSVRNSIELSSAHEEFAERKRIRLGLRNKSFVGEDFSDLHQLQNSLRERDVFRSSILVQLEIFKRKISAVEKRIEQEKKTMDLSSKTIIKAKNKVVLWENLISNGQAVLVGKEMLRVLNCDSAIITLSVSQGIFNRLEIRKNAQFILDGSGKKYEAKIIRLAGSGASRLYRNIAIPPDSKNENRFEVVLRSEALRDDVGQTCAVGSSGRVFFDERPFDLIRDLIN